MKKALKFLVVAMAVVLTLLLVFVLTGILSSESYSGSGTAIINASSPEVWEHLSDIESFGKRKEIKKVELLGKNEKGLPRWKEYTDMGGHIVFEQLESIPGRKLKLKMDESTFGMTGTWTYDLIAEGDEKTKVILSEESRIKNILVRSILTCTGRDANIEKELEILKKMNGQK